MAPDDPNGDMDVNDYLPSPRSEQSRKWLTPKEAPHARAAPLHGRRHFEHYIDVPKNGCQHNWILAAHYLCLLDPGTPLFNTVPLRAGSNAASRK